MPKIILDAGHGGTDFGAVYNEHVEKDIVLDVVLQAAHYIRPLPGVVLFLTRAFDFFLSLQKRCELANKEYGDLFISVHCNADPDDDAPGKPVAKGDEIWVYPNSIESRNFAEILQRHASSYSIIHRGIKESSGLYVLRHTKMPAVLVEIGFIDDPAFAEKPPVDKVALAITDSVKEYFNAVHS